MRPRRRRKNLNDISFPSWKWAVPDPRDPCRWYLEAIWDNMSLFWDQNTLYIVLGLNVSSPSLFWIRGDWSPYGTRSWPVPVIWSKRDGHLWMKIFWNSNFSVGTILFPHTYWTPLELKKTWREWSETRRLCLDKQTWETICVGDKWQCENMHWGGWLLQTNLPGKWSGRALSVSTLWKYNVVFNTHKSGISRGKVLLFLERENSMSRSPDKPPSLVLLWSFFHLTGQKSHPPGQCAESLLATKTNTPLYLGSFTAKCCL